jgi:hypothetical protein
MPQHAIPGEDASPKWSVADRFASRLLETALRHLDKGRRYRHANAQPAKSFSTRASDRRPQRCEDNFEQFPETRYSRRHVRTFAEASISQSEENHRCRDTGGQL